MRLDWFLCRRSLAVPTLAGWAALAAAAGAVAVLLALALPRFLAVDEPVGRGTLVVEGWLPRKALELAAETARRGGYESIVVTGGPIRDVPWGGGFPTYAERAGAYVRSLDVGGREIFVVPAPDTDRDRTFEAARAVRRWLDSSGRRVDAVDVFSYGPHARRSRDLYRLALGSGVAVGCRAAAPVDYELASWWRRSDGARDIIGEAVGYAWMVCCFSPREGR